MVYGDVGIGDKKDRKNTKSESYKNSPCTRKSIGNWNDILVDNVTNGLRIVDTVDYPFLVQTWIDIIPKDKVYL